MLFSNKNTKKIIPIITTAFLFNILSYPIINMNTSFADDNNNTINGMNLELPNAPENATISNNDSSSTKDGTNEQQQNLAAQAIMGVTGGIPIGHSAKYTYTSTFGIKYANAVCKPGEGGSKPTANEKVSYQCMVWVRNGAAIPPIVTLSDTPSASGEQEITTTVPAARWVLNSDGKGKHYEVGAVSITIKYNAYAGNTTIGGESWSDFNKDASDSNNSDSNDYSDSGTTSGDSGSSSSSSTSDSGGTDLCPDGTYNCNLNPSGSNTGTDGTNGTNGTGTNGTNGTNGTSSDDNALDDLINDLNDKNNNAYNSGSNDWANSNGGKSDGTGTDNLDNYFKDVGDGTSDDGLNGLTDDVLGVDDLINQAIPQEEAQEIIDKATNTGNTDATLDEEGNNDSNGSYNNDGNTNNAYSSNDSDESNSKEPSSLSSALSSLYQDGLGGLDGTTDDNSENGDLIGNKDDSLVNKLKDILNKNTDDVTGNLVASDQDLFDLAKKILLDNGMSLNDIRNGLNYDKNSAYTDPSSSWDMNRITKLLKEKKVKITSQTDIQTKDPINTLSNTSNKEINKKK